MRLDICWLMSTPHGDTTLSMEMPLIESADDNIEDYDTAKTEATTQVA